MAKRTKLRDHGAFTINSPQEAMILVHLEERAAKNTEKPGQAWGRFEARRNQDGRAQQGFKVYHLDTNANRLTVTEAWEGVETARKTVAFDEIQGDVPEAPAGPTAPPDPGPETPTFYRLPFHAADLLPEDELREWLMERAELDVLGLSVLPRRIRLFGEGFQEVVALPQPIADGVAPGTGATLRALGSRPGVERRFVEGWFGSVDGRGTACILEAPGDGAWWLAMRTFERRPGMIGRWTGAWSQQSGSGAETLTSLLRTVLSPNADERPIPVGEPMPPEQPEIGMFGGELPAAESAPATAEAVADRVGRDWEAKLPLGESPSGARLTVFRGREWETWVLEGDFPMGLDDMIRAISARGVQPTSLALVHMGVFAFEGDAFRALVTEGEAQGRRYTRALLIRLAPDGTVLGHRVVFRDHGEVGDDAWIGVPPITEMSLFTLQSGDA